MVSKNKKIDENLKVMVSPEEVTAFFAKYGNYRIGSGPTIEEMYRMFKAREMGELDL